MGGPRAGVAPESSTESMDSILKAYQANLPSILSATSSLTPELAQKELQASQGVTGGYNQLALDQMRQYGLPLAQQVKAIDDATNPAYAQIRDLTATKTADLLNSINLNGLSGGEQAAVERSLNQSGYATGNLGLDNATNAVSNAMQYGDRLSQKRADLGAAIGSANAFAGTRFGTGSPIQTGTPISNNEALGFGQGMLGSQTSIANNQNNLLSEYNWRNSRGYALSDAGRNASSVCCFIFLEALNGQLPWYVRSERNYYYSKEPVLAAGYKKMARWLVPLMRRHSMVKWLVNLLMVKPLIQVGGYDHLVNNTGYLLRPIKVAWFYIWRKYGTA